MSAPCLVVEVRVVDDVMPSLHELSYFGEMFFAVSRSDSESIQGRANILFPVGAQMSDGASTPMKRGKLHQQRAKRGC